MMPPPLTAVVMLRLEDECLILASVLVEAFLMLPLPVLLAAAVVLEALVTVEVGAMLWLADFMPLIT